MDEKEIKLMEKFKAYVEATNILDFNKQIILTSINDFIEDQREK